MTKFDAIGIRTAKEQAPPISADGLAGACGRLRCYLRFEYEQYAKSTVSCLVSEKRLEPPTVWPQL